MPSSVIEEANKRSTYSNERNEGVVISQLSSRPLPDCFLHLVRRMI